MPRKKMEAGGSFVSNEIWILSIREENVSNNFEHYHLVAKNSLIMEKEISTLVVIMPLNMIMYLLATFWL